MMVMTVSVVENCVPNPKERSMRKKRIDQSGEIGIRETASGYAMNARPAPEEIYGKHSGDVYPLCSVLESTGNRNTFLN